MLPFSSREESGILVIMVENPDGLGGVRDPLIRDAIYGLVPAQSNVRVAIDLARADYLSSSGIALLIGLKRRVEQQGGQLILCSVQPVVRELLAIMRLEAIFQIADDLPSAVSSFRSVSTD